MSESTLPLFPQLILKRSDQILLLRRAPTSKFYGGYWHLPTGKIEKNESPLETIIREAHEEVGMIIKPKLVLTVYNRIESFFDATKIWQDVCLFFEAEALDQDPVNVEPNKHDKMAWFKVDNMPDKMIPHIQFGIEAYSKGQHYAEYINAAS
ncbi:NUDIX domain-containing protein [Candidatus Odyssella thessalonicensis]|uniref:NUDIX domain-containing protein n=1 Tax=Candidatus Odyssella thessalonicensis TaxID=84647 RepID=UPI000225C16B|nr:NUDIX domain-containing protein [Candidatus Odyssella thessalonicensis]